MKKQAKQFTSLLCVLALCLTLLPVSALASGLEEPGTPAPTPTASMSPEPSAEPSPEPTPEESTEPTPVPTETPAPENETELFADDSAVYVSADGSADGNGTREKPYATLAEAVKNAPDGATVYLLSDLVMTKCARVINKSLIIDGQGHTVTRGTDVETVADNARSFYNPALFEINTWAEENPPEEEVSPDYNNLTLTFRNITIDDAGRYEGTQFAQQEIGEGHGDNTVNVQDAIVATYITNTIILDEGTKLLNYGGMSAVRITGGGTLLMKDGSSIEDTTFERTDGHGTIWGAVNAQGGNVIMEDGSAIQNLSGRAIFLDSSFATINGTIQNIRPLDTMKDADAGLAVYIWSDGKTNDIVSKATLGSTGKITNIIGNGYGEGDTLIMARNSGSTFKMEYGAEITNIKKTAVLYPVYSSETDPVTINGRVANCDSSDDGYLFRGFGAHTVFDTQSIIENNKSSSNGVFYSTNGVEYTFRGTIRNNNALRLIYLIDHSGAPCKGTIEDGALITGNSGIAVYINQSASLTMTGGEISDNGTGVSLSGKNAQSFTMTGGKIVDNNIGISYSSMKPQTWVKLQGGEVSGNGSDYQVAARYGSSKDDEAHLEVSADVLQGNTSIALGLGTITLDNGYADIALGTASDSAEAKIASLLEDGHTGWETVSSYALWFKPTTDSFHFTMPKSYSVENGRGLYAGYIPLKEDGTPADNAALTVVPVENEAILDITVSNLTPDTSYALMLIHSNEYTIKPDDITIYTGGETEGGLPNGTFVNSTLEASDISSITIGDTTTNYTYSNRNEGYELLNSLFEVTGYYNTDNQQIKNDQIPGEYTAQIGLTDAANQKGLFVADDGLVSGLKINGNTVKLADGILTIRYVSDTDEAIQDDGLTTDIVSDDAGVNEALSNADGKGIALIKGTPTYYTNGEASGLGETAENAQIALLFDDLLPADLGGGGDREQMLVAEAESQGHSIQNRSYEFKYLDLVDVSNGNAWVSTDSEITIYWPLPEGTDESTKFELLHFTGLHREYGQLYNEDELAQQIAGSEVVAVKVENTGFAVKFTLDGNAETGSFSPFALVWGEVQEPDPDPEPEPTPDPEPSDPGSSSGGSTSVRRYNIEADAGRGGDISPDGRVRVRRGENQTFRITPDEGYEIYDVIVDGESVGAVGRYTFENVREDHTISVTFRLIREEVDTGVSRWLNTEDHIAYLQGYPGGLFGPDDNMTRAEAAQMLYNLLLEQDVASTVSFTDVAPDAWYADAVNALASLGMVEGVGGGLFAPERTITRAEFTVIAMRFAYLPDGGENPFSDVAEDDWFYDQVVGAVQYGWITGYPDGTFGSEDTITRAEVTAIVNRMLNRQADEDYVDSHAEELIQFTDLSPAYWAYYDIMEAANGHTYEKDGDTEIWTGIR